MSAVDNPECTCAQFRKDQRMMFHVFGELTEGVSAELEYHRAWCASERSKLSTSEPSR